MSDRRTRDRLFGNQLESHEFDDDVKGKPLNIPSVNFTISLEKKIQALSGPPYYAVRARRIEQMTDQLMEDLSAEYRKSIERFGSRPGLFTRKWKELIKTWPLDNLNALIEKHNKYYPIEADLKMDPRSGAPMMGSIPWEPKGIITKEDLLQWFPLDITDTSL